MILKESLAYGFEDVMLQVFMITEIILGGEHVQYPK